VLVPADWICASIDDCAPVPSATIVMTAATPMIMPSMVSAVRSLFLPSALNAIRTIMKTDMVLLTARSAERRQQPVPAHPARPAAIPTPPARPAPAVGRPPDDR